MSTKENQEVTPEQMQSVWDEEAAKLTAPADESQPVVEAAADTPDEQPAEVAAEPAVADPMAGLPDAVREKLASLDKMSERLRAVEGNVGGLSEGHKQLKTLLTASQEAAKTGVDAPTQAAVKAAIQTPEAWQSLKEEFPEWSNAVESFVDSRIAGTAAPSVDASAVEKLVDAQLAKITPAIRREVAEDFLEGEFEGWKDWVKKPEFTDWLNAQPEETKVLAGSERVSDAAKLLRLYKQPDKAVDPGKAIKDARKETLDAAAALPKGAHVPATKRVEDMSPQELWAYEASQTEKRRASRGY